jgi:hypothetical protein
LFSYQAKRFELALEENIEMTRKDYQLIAEVFANFGKMIELNETIGADIARDLADALQGDNPRFDRARFLDACGVN